MKRDQDDSIRYYAIRYNAIGYDLDLKIQIYIVGIWFWIIDDLIRGPSLPKPTKFTQNDANKFIPGEFKFPCTSKETLG